jgi:hypothetical protein
VELKQRKINHKWNISMTRRNHKVVQKNKNNCGEKAKKEAKWEAMRSTVRKANI